MDITNFLIYDKRKIMIENLDYNHLKVKVLKKDYKKIKTIL